VATADPGRRILTADVLSIGSELTVGDTRDTNAGELARSLTASGVAVSRLTAVPDRLDVVAEAFAAGLTRSDMVVSTGGLGPTPDDLTREAIAQVLGEIPVIDPDQERWLRALWARRRLPFPEVNLKQAWLVPSAAPLPNPQGTAPGWFVVRPDGRVIVAMPGPPREMRPMWRDEVLPRLNARGLGSEVANRTYRLTGIGESQVAEILGDDLLRAENPKVATYARAEAVDVRVSAVPERGPDGTLRSAAELVSAAGTVVSDLLREHIWATGETTWSAAIGTELEARGWRLAILSNTDRDLIDASMEALGVPFEMAIVAGEIGSYKPAHRHWEVFRERTNADPAGHVHVAQSLFHDIAPAAELRIPSIWINRLGEPADPRPARTLSDVARLADALDELVPG